VYWDCPREWGAEISGFIQEHRSEILNFAPTTSLRGPVLARPAIDLLTGLPTSILVANPNAAFPNQIFGEAHIKGTLQLGGAEFNLQRSLLYCDMVKLNLLGGIRYVDHHENLEVLTRSYLPAAANDITNADIIDISDKFSTRNQFVGGQVGAHGEVRAGRYFADFTGKIAIGNVHETLDIRGFTNTNIGGTTTATNGGLLALDSNTGRFSQNKYCYVPELTVKLGYQMTQRISSYVGYNFLYISDLLRPAEQIDPVVNPTLVPTSPTFGIPFGDLRPLPQFHETSFWVQGITFGLTIRY